MKIANPDTEQFLEPSAAAHMAAIAIGLEAAQAAPAAQVCAATAEAPLLALAA